MLPLRDNIPSRTTPFINYLMIALCTLAFISQLSQAKNGVSLIEQLGMIPARVQSPDAEILIHEERIVVHPQLGPVRGVVDRPAAPSLVPPFLTVVTCIFLHGGWMHFLGNMWFLYIFGDNVEDRLGHTAYLIFYVAAGAAASLVHFASDPSSTVPTIGASGAIAGVMGAYMFLYPKAQVVTLIPIIIIIQIVVLPAPIFLGIWFAIQFFNGVASISNMQATGVAWWAHIGGFVAGAAVALVLNKLHRLRPEVEVTLERDYPRRIYPRR